MSKSEPEYSFAVSYGLWSGANGSGINRKHECGLRWDRFAKRWHGTERAMMEFLEALETEIEFNETWTGNHNSNSVKWRRLNKLAKNQHLLLAAIQPRTRQRQESGSGFCHDCGNPMSTPGFCEHCQEVH